MDDFNFIPQQYSIQSLVDHLWEENAPKVFDQESLNPELEEPKVVEQPPVKKPSNTPSLFKRS